MKCLKCGQCCRRSIIDEVYEIDLGREPRLKSFVQEFRSEPGRFMLKTPCPFLTVANQCDIYPTRPTVCVEYQPGSTMICTQYDGVDDEEEESS